MKRALSVATLVFASLLTLGRLSLGAGGVQKITGAGATFPLPLYRKWCATFQKKFPEFSIDYRGVGSGAGIEALIKGEVDFAGSDAPLTDAERAVFPIRIEHIPSVIGGVAVAYRLDGIQQRLRFTPGTLAGIYMGTIKRWNDRQLRAANRGATLPDREIAVIHRSDRSGTTYIFTSYLSRVSPEWKTALGEGTAVPWPLGKAADGNDAVAGLVSATPDSIGYLEFYYALEHRLSYGSVRNSAGQYVDPDLTTLAAAASGAVEDTGESIVNAPGQAAYPIASFSYFLVPTHFTDAGKGKAMTEFLRWMLDTGQKQCGALGYAALPPGIVERARSAVERIDSGAVPSQ